MEHPRCTKGILDSILFIVMPSDLGFTICRTCLIEIILKLLELGRVQNDLMSERVVSHLSSVKKIKI